MIRGRLWSVLGCVLLASLQPASAADTADAGTYEAAVREAGTSFGAGDAHASLTHIERALAARPEGVGAHVLLSQIHLSLGHHQEAAAVLERLVGIVGPGSPLGLDALTLQGYALGLAERYAEAADRLGMVLAAAPDRPVTNMLLGRINLQLGRCRSALACFQREVDVPRNHQQPSRLAVRWPASSVREGIGLAAYQCGDTRLARESLASVPVSEMSVEGRHHLALLLAHEGKHWDAVRQFEKVLSADADNRGALLGLMRSAAAAGLAPLEREAREALDKLYAADQERNAARVRAGDLQTAAARSLAAGDRGAAVRALDEAAGLTEDPFALSLIARHQHHAGDAAGAERTLQRVLSAAPFVADGHAAMGIIKRDHGDLAAAAASFERAARLVPTEMSFRIRLAGIYSALDRASDALDQLRQARDMETAFAPRADLTGLGVTGPDLVEDAIAAARADARWGRGSRQEFERILGQIDSRLVRRRAALLSSLATPSASAF